MWQLSSRNEAIKTKKIKKMNTIVGSSHKAVLLLATKQSTALFRARTTWTCRLANQRGALGHAQGADSVLDASLNYVYNGMSIASKISCQHNPSASTSGHTATASSYPDYALRTPHPPPCTLQHLSNNLRGGVMWVPPTKRFYF
jgi:hypothetical protein